MQNDRRDARSALRSGRGYTLVELVVCVMLLGILSAIAIPQYISSVENSKALGGANLAAMIAGANRMYAVDHGGAYTHGPLRTSCASAACIGTGNPGQPCDLVACKYMAYQDFDSFPYAADAVSPIMTNNCAGYTSPQVACVGRRNSSIGYGTNGTDNAPYNSWGYAVDPSGSVIPMPAGGPPTGPPTPPP